MLQSLHIKDLALIEEAAIEFADGFNVISGETGGGKSLLVTALKLLRGERGTATLVRHGASELRVEGVFVLEQGERSRQVAEFLREQCGAEVEDDQIIVSRTLDAAGRSKVRINGALATLPVLRELGEQLLEIHGQGETRSLMRPEIQAELIDAFAGTTGLREQYAETLGEARRYRVALDEAKGDERLRQQRQELLTRQVADLEALRVEPGELEKLDAECLLLGNLDRTRELLNQALLDLQDGEPSVADLLGRAEREVQEAAALDPRLGEAAEQLHAAARSARDACRAVQSGLARLDLDPGRLQQALDRVAALRGALQRFGPTEADLLRRLAGMREESAALTEASAALANLQRDLQATLEQAGKLARRLVRARKKAVPLFTAAIEAELADLGMEATTMSVVCGEEFTDEELLLAGGRHGPTPLDIHVRINPGEPGKPLRDTASGGEMARVVLALKKCLADQDRVPFVVFDEIDAEIGGRLGLQVGKKLRDVAKNHQVLMVTHLPQVAAFANAHFKVGKRVHKERTLSTIARLDARQIEKELAAMALGDGADAQAIQEARRLVERAREA